MRGTRRSRLTAELIDLPQLQSIGVGAFNRFAGRVQLTGSFPALVEVGPNAFNSASNPASVVELKDLRSCIQLAYKRSPHL